MRSYMVLRVVSKLLLPFILMFALYVQFHGDFGPGGGFQAGVIFASGFILYGLVFGTDSAERLLPPGVLRSAAAIGVLLYGGVGLYNVLAGGLYLDYGVMLHDPVHGQELGIALIEAGVGITVASVMTLLFYTFAAYRARREPRK